MAFSIPFSLLFRALDWPMDVAFNLLTAGVASLSVVLEFLLVRDIARSRFAGASAALLLSFVPVYWSVTTHALVHAFSVMLVLLAFTVLRRAQARGSRALAAAAATALVLAVSARIPNLLLLPAFACAWLEPRLRGGRLRIDRERIARQAPFVAAPLVIGLAAMGWAQGELVLEKARYDAFLGPRSPVFPRALRSLGANLNAAAWILVAAGAGLSLVGPRRGRLGGPMGHRSTSPPNAGGRPRNRNRSKCTRKAGGVSRAALALQGPSREPRAEARWAQPVVGTGRAAPSGPGRQGRSGASTP